MRCEYCTDKIQTGLRIPSKRYEELHYEELQYISQEIGVSLNSLILMLIDLGLSLRSRETSPLSEQL